MSHRRRSVTAAIAVALGLAVLASRLPFLATTLWSWDSVLYARALELGFHVDWDLADQRPHAPGYLFYVLTAAVFRGVLGDSNAALVTVSAVASALGTAGLFLFARRFARTGIALVAACAYAAAPLVWTYSEIAFPYSMLGALSIGLAALFWIARGRSTRWLLVASVAFGLAAGFRQDLLVLLGPLWLWTVGARGPRAGFAAGTVLAATCLTWLIPTALLSDGLADYLDALGTQAGTVSEQYSAIIRGLPAFTFNLQTTLYALLWGGIGACLLGVTIAARLLAGGARPTRPSGPLARFLALWVFPGLLFYVVVHIGDWGYVSSLLPALYLLLAVLAEHAVAAGQIRSLRWRAVGAAAALAPALLFLIGTDRFSAAALREHDAGITERAAYVRANFPASETIILAREDFLTARYYLPEYRAWRYDPAPHESRVMQRRRALRATSIVVFTEGLEPRSPIDVRVIRLASGIRICQLLIQPGDVVELSGDHYRVRDPL
jgi:hypothetical protein